MAEGENSAFEKIINKIEETIDDLVTLEIITAVGEGDDARAASNKKIHSKLGLLDGDIYTIFHEDFINGDLKELRQFHEQREEKGAKIIQENINTLIKIVEFARGLKKEKE